MTTIDSDIADMQCWLMRMAQRKWGKSGSETARIFHEYDVLGYIRDLYGILHLSSYDSALKDIEGYLMHKGALGSSVL